MSKDPGPEGPALQSPLEGSYASNIFETGQPVWPVGRFLPVSPLSPPWAD